MKQDNNIRKNTIIQYYEEIGLKTIFADSIFKVFNVLGGFKKNTIIVTESKLIRIIVHILRMRGIYAKNVLSRAEQYFALKDALLLLNKKNIPVFFYNRIGKEKSSFVYSRSAQNRMEKHLNFPRMYESQNDYETDLKELFGDLYNKEYIEKIGKIPQVVDKGNYFCHEDYASEYVNVIGGQRVVCYQPEEYKRTIHIYGRCGAFGYAVEDKYSIPSQIQLQLIKHGITDVRVCNHGLWGGEDAYLLHNFITDSLGYKEGDIILFYMKHFHKNLIKHLEDVGLIYKEITHEWHEYPEAKWCFYDKPGHMNHIGYEHVGEIIVNDLLKKSLKCKPANQTVAQGFTSEKLNAYLKKENDSNFIKEIDNYTNAIIKEYPLDNNMIQCGSIVMNCNPFTKGHRYLIEYAAKRVDRLYIFVVQEDKSFFKFEDRFDMVKKGCEDLDNVVVVSSGKFIISSLTFPEYFMKDYVKEKEFDVSMDVETFCKHIAPPLRITKRFAGEEPFDPVTLNYNENMRRILPQYGMEFCEIPRLALDEQRVINATEVRRLLKERDFEAIREYVPETTVKILKEKY